MKEIDWDAVAEAEIAMSKIKKPKSAAITAALRLTERCIHGEFACYDASCRPPTSGGTGGSSPKKPRLPAIRDDYGSVIKAALGAWEPDGDFSRAQSALARIYELRGFNAKPTIVDRETLTEMFDSGEVHIGHRGVNPAERNEAIAYSLLEGETHWPGRGAFGDGTYVAATPSDMSEAASRLDALSYGQDIIRMGVPDEIMNVDYYEMTALQNMVMSRLDGNTERFPEDSDWAWEVSSEIVRQGQEAGISAGDMKLICDDTGRLAAIAGVSGYSTSYNEGVSYVVVFDRSKLIIDSQVYRRDGIVPQYERKAELT